MHLYLPKLINLAVYVSLRQKMILLLFGLSVFFGVNNLIIAQQNVWEPAFAGNNPSVLYYPDQQAVYLRYAWEHKPGRGLVIKGKMPDARYFSFNLYDDYTKSSLAALADYEIKADVGDPSSYTIYLFPAGAPENYPNSIRIPDSIEVASVFLRYYVPQGNIYANRPLPEINFWENGAINTPLPSVAQPVMTAEDMAKLKSQIMANPKLLTNKEKKVLKSATSTFAEKEPIICKVMTMPIFQHYSNPSAIASYKFNPGGNYPNKDNHYIVMPVIRKKNDFLLVRFKAPTYTIMLGDTSKNVRYYSLSQGNEYTNTSATLYDNQLRVSEDGFIYVLVADDKKGNREKATEMGINFMPWMYKDHLVLILRHMLPSPAFNYSIREVPLFIKSKPAAGQEAQKAIGPYALEGKFFTPSSWKTMTNTIQFGF